RAAAGRPFGTAESAASAAGTGGDAEVQPFGVAHRRRLAIPAAHRHLPHDFPRRRVVAADLLAAADDEIGAVLRLPDERRTPCGPVVARNLPRLLAGLRVERQQERLLLVVALDVDLAVVDDRRATGAVPEHRRVRAEVFLPELLTGKVEAKQAGVAEVGVHALAVGDRRFGRVGVARVDGRLGLPLDGGLVPEYL